MPLMSCLPEKWPPELMALHTWIFGWFDSEDPFSFLQQQIPLPLKLPRSEKRHPPTALHRAQISGSSFEIMFSSLKPRCRIQMRSPARLIAHQNSNCYNFNRNSLSNFKVFNVASLPALCKSFKIPTALPLMPHWPQRTASPTKRKHERKKSTIPSIPWSHEFEPRQHLSPFLKHVINELRFQFHQILCYLTDTQLHTQQSNQQWSETEIV